MKIDVWFIDVRYEDGTEETLGFLGTREEVEDFIRRHGELNVELEPSDSKEVE